MKKVFSFIIALLFINITYAQNVGIGTTTPNASAILELKDTTRGFLPPRMTIPQRTAISNPQKGLLVWCIDCDELQVFNGTFWKNIANGAAACTTPDIPNVVICSQVWMDKNLDVTAYRNGDPIPKITDDAAWAVLSTGAYCYYNNDSATYAATYGKLYNWYAVNDPRGLAPAGWHVPSDAEWTTLSTCLGGLSAAGGALKEAGTTHWIPINNGATNSSGFTALPGGGRNPGGTVTNDIGQAGWWWTATQVNATFAFYYRMISATTALYPVNDDKRDGFSVRCVKD